MATTIVTKNSSTAAAVPTAAQLVQGELAVNVADKRLYTEDSVGGIVELGTNPSAEIVANGGIALPDNGKATFGAGDDLQIYHDGSNSYITDTGTGSLVVRASEAIKLQAHTGEFYFQGFKDGTVKLYYDNAEKLLTTSTGIDVTGTATMDGLTVDGDLSLTGVATIGADAGGEANVLTLKGRTSDNDGYIKFTSSNGATSYAYAGVPSANTLAFYTNGFTKRLDIGSGGDISFYEDTGTTAKLFWDASAESLGIGTSSPSEKLELIHNGANRVRFSLNDTGNNLQFWNDNTPTFAAAIGTGNPTSTLSGTDGLKFDIYNGSWSEAMRIDSAGNVGIGTSTPASGLHLVNDGLSNQLRLSNTTADSTTKYGSVLGSHYSNLEEPIVGMLLTSSSSATGGAVSIGGGISSANAVNTIKFYTAANNTTLTGSERMRIDSAGNLLVGKTAIGTGTVGAELRANGFNAFVRSGGEVMNINRLSSDGTIIDFRKDSSTVGSIGTEGGNLYIEGSSATGKTGIEFLGSAWYPRNDGANSNGAVDLGDANNRFKDLYLSGGVYLGGTGAANKLDDYEEGDYLAAVTMGSGTLTLNTSFNRLSYTKVGRLVTVTGLLIASAGSGLGGSVRINLPFTCASLTGRAADSAGSLSVVNSASCPSGSFGLRIFEGSSDVYIFDGSGTTTIDAGSSMASNVQLYLSITYVTI